MKNLSKIYCKKRQKQGIVDNKNIFIKIVEKFLKNVLTINFVFGIITKSLVTKASTTASQKEDRTLTNKQ